jgi:outer membrane protein
MLQSTFKPVSASILSAVALTAALWTPAAQSAEGPWMVRVRAVNLDAVNKPTGSLGANVSANDKVIPEVDISYFFSPNLAAELILTVPQKHDVRLNGAVIGSLKHLPPTLTLQYHFDTVGGKFKPYVGAGINYTRFSSVKLPDASYSIEKSSVGLALQAGVDIPLDKNLYLNFDVKKVQIRTDLTVAGTNYGAVKVDPVLFGVGLGWRF